MTSLLKSAAAAALLTVVATPAFAQTNQVTTNATTQIIRPVTIAETSALAFGRIVKPATGSSVITLAAADTDDTPNVTSGTALLLTSTTSRAAYTVTGEGGQQVTVALSSLTLGNGTDTIAVTLDRNPTGNLTLSGALGDEASGTASLHVGGSFTVPSAISTGDYTGSYTVTVAYQ